MSKTTDTNWQPLKKLSRGNVAQHILEDVREQILTGRISRGEKMPTEKQLAESYGVSAATVREAIRGLSTMHLIDVRHGSGAYVTADADQLVALSLQSMIQLERITITQVLGVLGALNSYSAELAVTNASDHDLTKMYQSLEKADHGANSEEIANGITEFVDALAVASGNPLLASLCRFLASIQISLAQRLTTGNLAEWRVVAGSLALERRTLLASIQARDIEKARVAARAYHERALLVINSLPNATSATLPEASISTFLSSLLQDSPAKPTTK